MVAIVRLSVLKTMIAAFAAMSASAIAHAEEIIAVRFGVHDTHTRIVVETRTEMEFRAFASGEVTPRLIVDIPGAGWAVSGLEGGQGQGHGLAGRFRFDPAAQSPRLIFDLTENVRVRESFVLPPGDGGYRMVIDIEPVPAQVVTAANSGFDPSDQTMTQFLAERVQVSYVPPRCERPRIVIDPGHGGRDPGAPGRFGSVSESHLALAAGLALRDILNTRGRYEVVMTRDRDVFLELDERIQVARRAQADIFISLHADAAPNSATGPRGAAVYTLSDSGTNRARNRARQDGEWLPASNNRSPQVNDLLLEMSLQEKRNQSLIFASSILESSASVTPLFRREPLERGFWVLLDSQIPAVLFEMGFMTNPDDSRNLNTPAHRQQLMTAVADSIDQYFAVCNNSGTVRTASAGTVGAGPASR
ncbi:MAG: N-acetylmuramoyl-L-alanine amidase AmiA [Oceanicaulis sp. HLUCCA04]|nr:MAG: N-acetylmuramoyl-L-alanine amidase AmiA [Oceanicaulis sp. HLUCCA04]